MKMKRIIISGSNGFIGTNLTNYALNHGVEVFALVFPGTVCSFVSSPLLHIIPFDLQKASSLPNLINERGFDCFYHFAWIGVFGKESADYITQTSNIVSACEAVKAAKELNCNTFIYPSSVMEYDCMRSSSAIDGAVPNSRTSYYGAKMAACLLAKHLASQIGINFVEAVLSNVYGPTLNPGFITNSLTKFLKGEHASFSSGEQFYDFIYISDAAKALYYVGDKRGAFASYYIGSENPQKLKYFILDMKDCVDPNIKPGFGEIKTSVVDMNLNFFDTQKLSRETGFHQSVDFKTGILKTIDWLKKNSKNHNCN
ncbi:MAG: NAD(P)-dependent oxidoreductase [Bacilli bacterium]|jgi:nucleoside-diphosphate-sugar epimerase|nr:NAD(P)-dependent oxidoreductase [Bacilli bacterium]